MKRILVAGVVLTGIVALGLMLLFLPDRDRDPEFGIVSLDESLVQVEDEYLYVIEGTTQEELLQHVENNGDYDVEMRFSFTTSERGEKQKEELFSYDRLYIEASLNGEELERYYHIIPVEEL